MMTTQQMTVEERIAQVLAGKTVLANMHKHSGDARLIEWAKQKGLFVRIDRHSIWGNPFIVGVHGTRDEVCDKYEKEYLPNQPSLLKQIHELKGKVLGCWCYPLRCHGLSCKQKADEA